MKKHKRHKRKSNKVKIFKQAVSEMKYFLMGSFLVLALLTTMPVLAKSSGSSLVFSLKSKPSSIEMVKPQEGKFVKDRKVDDKKPKNGKDMNEFGKNKDKSDKKGVPKKGKLSKEDLELQKEGIFQQDEDNRDQELFGVDRHLELYDSGLEILEKQTASLERIGIVSSDKKALKSLKSFSKKLTALCMYTVVPSQLNIPKFDCQSYLKEVKRGISESLTANDRAAAFTKIRDALDYLIDKVEDIKTQVSDAQDNVSAQDDEDSEDDEDAED